MRGDSKDGATLGGRIFVGLVELSVIIVMGHALVNSVGGTEPFGLFNRIYFGGYDMHRYTVLIIFSSFIVHWFKTQYLYPLTRFVTCSSLTVFYIYFHHLLWTVNSLIFRGTGAWRLPVIGTIFAVLIVYQLNAKHGFLKWVFNEQDTTIMRVFMGLQIVGIIGMASTGFWSALTLSDAGLGSDPNINFWWILWKGASFWMLYPALRGSSLKAPLRMNPEVF